MAITMQHKAFVEKLREKIIQQLKAHPIETAKEKLQDPLEFIASDEELKTLAGNFAQGEDAVSKARKEYLASFFNSLVFDYLETVQTGESYGLLENSYNKTANLLSLSDEGLKEYISSSHRDPLHGDGGMIVGFPFLILGFLAYGLFDLVGAVGSATLTSFFAPFVLLSITAMIMLIVTSDWIFSGEIHLNNLKAKADALSISDDLLNQLTSTKAAAYKNFYIFLGLTGLGVVSMIPLAIFLPATAATFIAPIVTLAFMVISIHQLYTAKHEANILNKLKIKLGISEPGNPGETSPGTALHGLGGPGETPSSDPTPRGVHGSPLGQGGTTGTAEKTPGTEASKGAKPPAPKST